MKYNQKNSVLNTDAWDHHTFHSVYDAAVKFKENINGFAKKDNERFGLIGDVFSALYKYTPMLKSQIEALKTANSSPNNEGGTEQQDILKTLMSENKIAGISNETSKNPNETLLKKVLEHEEYNKLHPNSKGDKLHSSISTMALGEELHQWLEHEKSTNEEFKQSLQAQNEAQRSLQKAEESIQKRNEQGKNPTKTQEQKYQDAQSQLTQANASLAQIISNKMDSNTLGQMIAKSAKQANETKDDVQALLGGAGQGDAELKKMPLGGQIAIADMLRNNDEVRKIAEMAGKFKSIARKKQKQKYKETIQRNGVSVGNDIERLLPQELALYANLATKNEFLRRFAESQTLMYSPQGKEILGKGPLVVVLDESGSMHNLNPQAKGFVIALAMIAKKQKRDLIVIPFSNDIGTPTICEKGKVTTQHIVDWATKFLSGGTKYMPPLLEAQRVIKEQKRFKDGDIIFVTDGAPQDYGWMNKELPKFLAFKKSHKVNITSLLIGRDVTKEHVQKFSDKIINANSFLDDSAMEILDI
ncbi:hypothetical protein ACMGD3_24335 [Lysinibacillus sphaericus]|uniref:hypothetical protein n=1 Tax=Lysinibacillus sphaericus TaxID=1421 RepID=UPI003F79C957